jgi:DNA polymerase-1
MLLLVDADSIFWKAALGATRDFDGQKIEDLEAAVKSFEGRLGSILDSSPTKDYVLCYSGGRSFRVQIDPTYKAHRPKPPEFIGHVKNAVIKRWGGLMFPGLEGDDLVGMHHEPFALSADNSTLVYSEDKDLKQLAGNYLDVNHGVRFRTPDEAMRFFYMQVLIGDAADGYPGCPGIGPKKAEILLGTATRFQFWDIVCMTYERLGFTEEDAIKQAHLAWILKWNNGGPYHFIPPKRMSNKLDWSKLR